MKSSQVFLSVLAIPVLAGVVLAGGGGSAPVFSPSVVDSMGPVAVQGLGVGNFGVVDGRIFRGDQPAREDYAALKAFGISTIIDLRKDAKSYARSSAEAAGLRYVNIPMDDTDQPHDAQMVTFLKSVLDPGCGKAYVHCAGGRHRTGASIAVYRMAVDGWNADAAYREMLNYDFYTRWGHGGYKDYVFDYYSRKQADPASVPGVPQADVVVAQ